MLEFPLHTNDLVVTGQLGHSNLFLISVQFSFTLRALGDDGVNPKVIIGVCQMKFSCITIYPLY